MKARPLALSLLIATIALLGLGALVTSLRAGDSIPDWPGPWFPTAARGALVEYSHRVAAAVVALLSFALAICVHRTDDRRAVRALAWIGVVAVLAQALMGGVRIHAGDRPEVTVVHAGIAQVFLCIATALMVLTGGRRADADAPQAAVWGWAAAGATFVQILVGAYLRHTGAGIIPHLIGAVVVSGLVAMMSHVSDSGPARVALGLVGAQLVLGMGAWFLLDGRTKQDVIPGAYVWVATAHMIFGAAILAHCVIVAVRAGRSGRRAAATAAAQAHAKAAP
jgi:cytochrome c oxidase assembly protein subunit 15